MHPAPVLLGKFQRRSKFDPLLEEVDLLEANPDYAHIRLTEGHKRDSKLFVNNLIVC